MELAVASSEAGVPVPEGAPPACRALCTQLTGASAEESTSQQWWRWWVAAQSKSGLRWWCVSGCDQLQLEEEMLMAMQALGKHGQRALWTIKTDSAGRRAVLSLAQSARMVAQDRHKLASSTGMALTALVERFGQSSCTAAAHWRQISCLSAPS